MPRVIYEEGFDQELRNLLAAAAVREGKEWAERLRQYIEEFLRRLPEACAKAEELDRASADSINGPELEGNILLCKVLRPEYGKNYVITIKTSHGSIAHSYIRDLAWQLHDFFKDILPMVWKYFDNTHVELLRWI